MKREAMKKIVPFLIIVAILIGHFMPSCAKVIDERRTLKSRPDQEFFLYVPPSYKPGTWMPLLIAVHGAGGNGAGTFAEWKGSMDKEGYILVSPSFPDGYQWLQHDTDRRMVEIIYELRKELWIDMSKIFITGFSGGAQFCHRFALRYPELVVACAPSSAGMLDYPPSSAKRVRFRVSCGEQDTDRLAVAKEFQANLLREGYYSIFKMYPQTGHSPHADLIKDVLTFFSYFR